MSTTPTPPAEGQDARAEWLMNLSPGDEVLLVTGAVYFRHREIVPVERVTPTQVVLQGRGHYSKNGGRRVGGPSSEKIERLTDEGRAEVRKAQLVGDLGGKLYSRDHWKALSLDQLERIAAILAEGVDETNGT